MGVKKSQRRILVRKVEQLQGNLKPATEAVYVLEDVFDPTFTINLPAGGGGLAFEALSFDSGGFACTSDNHTLFSGTFSTSNILMSKMKLSHSGTNSKIFDIEDTSGFRTMEFNQVNFGEFDENVITPQLGTVRGVRQILFEGCGFARVIDGFELEGDIAGIACFSSIALFMPENSTLFKRGADFALTGDSDSNTNFSSPTNDDTFVVYDFLESDIQKDAGFGLNDSKFNRNANPLPNLPASSTKVQYKNCRGIENTNVRATMVWQNQVTTAITQNVETVLAGTTLTENGVWIDQTANNELTYQSNEEKFLSAEFSGTVIGSPNRQIRLIIKKFDNETSTEIEVARSTTTISNVFGDDLAIYDFEGETSGLLDDTFRVYAVNLTDSTNIALKPGANLKIKAV